MIRNLIQRGKRKAAAAIILAHTAIVNKRAEGFVDSGVKILIAVMIGALLLAGLYALFGDTIMPSVTNKVKELFNYTN